MKKIFFIHLHKAGGTSVATQLRKVFEPSQCTDLPVTPEFLSDRSQWRKYQSFDFIHGHCGYDFVRACEQNHYVIGNFRHPVSRIVSLYHYWRSTPEELEDHGQEIPRTSAALCAPRLARILNFSAFIRCDAPAVKMYTHNACARQLLGNWWTLKNMSIMDLIRIKRRIAAMHWFYVCERPYLSQAWFSRQFPFLANAGSFAQENMTNYRASAANPPSPEEVKFILAHNKADLHIYYYAVSLLEKRMKK